jgi:branched-chain amino acid transport system substrate-binding protein
METAVNFEYCIKKEGFRMNSKQNLKRWIVAAVCLLLTAAFTGCGGTTETSGDTTGNNQPASGNANEEAGSDVIKVGVVLATTGPQSVTGKWVLDGHKMAAMEINEAGGVKVGDRTYKIELIHYDSEGRAESATAATEKLIGQDKVIAIFGTSISSETAAMIPIAERAKTPLITSAAASQILTQQGAKFFTSAAVQTNNALSVYEDTVKDLGWKKVEILHLNDAWGMTMADAIKKLFAENGVEIAYAEPFAPDNKEFGVLLNKVKAAKPDGLMLVGQTEITVPIIKQAREIIPDIPLWDVGGSVLEEIAKLIPKEAEGLIGGTRTGRVETEEHKKFRERFLQTFGYEANSFVYSGYDGIYLLKDALERAGTVTDKEKINQAIRSANFTGLIGTYTFNEKGENSIKGLRGFVIDGQVVYQSVDEPIPDVILKR